MATPWTCRYCNRPCTISDNDVRVLEDCKHICNEYGHYCSELIIVVCPNPNCRQLTIRLTIYSSNQFSDKAEVVYHWDLLPESSAKPFPEYIPKAVLDDYKESCLIKTKSPKASATLSRRCLQGMIRDYWKISKFRLIDEINDLQDKVDATTWAAIVAVKDIGNIGAHMEKDVNTIIDVDENEASLLIWLIETLFQDWYIAKHEREERMAKLVEVANNKKEQKHSKQ